MQWCCLDATQENCVHRQIRHGSTPFDTVEEREDRNKIKKMKSQNDNKRKGKTFLFAVKLKHLAFCYLRAGKNEKAIGLEAGVEFGGVGVGSTIRFARTPNSGEMN